MAPPLHARAGSGGTSIPARPRLRRLREDPGGQGRLLPAVLAAGPLPVPARRRPAPGRGVGPGRTAGACPGTSCSSTGCSSAARTARSASTTAAARRVKPPPAPAGRPGLPLGPAQAVRGAPGLHPVRRGHGRRPRQPVAGLGTLPGLAPRRGSRLAAGTAARRPPGADHRAVPAPARRHRPVLRGHPAAAGPGHQRRADRRGAPGDGRCWTTTGAPSFEDWLERKLDGLAPGIRADAEAWLRTLRDGGPRSRPRDIATVWNHMNYVRPVLLAWSSQLRPPARGHPRRRPRRPRGSCTAPAAPTSWSRCGRCSRSARSGRRSSAARSRASGSASAPGDSSSR